MAETIVMVHGMWGGAWCWDNYKSYFESKGYCCLTPTLRHHDARSQDPPPAGLGTVSLQHYADDLEALIRKLDAPPIIMGHSMGGLLAQILGARGLGKCLVLLTPASPAGINALKFSVVRSFWSVLSKWGFWRNPHRIPYTAAVYAMMHRLPPDQRRREYDRLVFESGRAAAEIGFWLLDFKGGARVDASRLTCPVLVVAGTEDRITPATVTRKIAQKYKAVATYKEFAAHAHWVIGEPNWEEIANFVLSWIGNQ